MSRLTVPAWKCDRPECGWVWIAKGTDPPACCAKCKSRIWHREATVVEKAKHVQEAIPGVRPASSIVLDASRRVVPPPIVNEPVYREMPTPRCPMHRRPMVLNLESDVWHCPAPKCRFHADQEQVKLSFETADLASI